MRTCDKCIHFCVCFIPLGFGAYELPDNSDAMDCDNYLEKDRVKLEDDYNAE